MARPKASDLTDRELEVMRGFWELKEATAEEVRALLEQSGVRLAYVTVANVVRILFEKGFLLQTHQERPFRYRPQRSFSEVSHRMIGDFVGRLFNGSRESMLVQMFSEQALSPAERDFLERVLQQEQAGPLASCDNQEEDRHVA
jgi:BlaI family transcriptional regulator, penicillinase repressor